MNTQVIFDIESWLKQNCNALPVFYRDFTVKKQQTKERQAGAKATKYVVIDFYQTTMYAVNPHHKPVSRMEICPTLPSGNFP